MRTTDSIRFLAGFWRVFCTITFPHASRKYFSIYALFRTTSAFPLDIGIKILAFLVGAALGAISWMIEHASLLLSAMPSSYQPQLILTVFTVSILCAVVVSIGTYFVITSPKIGYWVLGGAIGIILFLWVGFFTKLGSASWT